MPKKYLKGFSKFSIFPILENTETSLQGRYTSTSNFCTKIE